MSDEESEALHAVNAKLREAAQHANPLYCDQGPNAGMWRVDLESVYLTRAELDVLYGDQP